MNIILIGSITIFIVHPIGVYTIIATNFALVTTVIRCTTEMPTVIAMVIVTTFVITFMCVIGIDLIVATLIADVSIITITVVTMIRGKCVQVTPRSIDPLVPSPSRVRCVDATAPYSSCLPMIGPAEHMMG